MKKHIALFFAVLMLASIVCACAAKAPAPAEGEKPAIELFIKQKTVTTETGAVVVYITNNTDKHYSYDYTQQLEKKDGESYESVPLANEAVALALLHISGGETQQLDFDFANHYAPLEKGSYRIVKTFTDDEGNQVQGVCEFDVF